jgi:metal-dependent hydrolase (beta-lactamase superfamily II)
MKVSAQPKLYLLARTGRRLPASAGAGYLRAVMTELKKFALEHVLAMHCSGQNFIDQAKQEMPEKLILCGTGSSFTCTA